MLTFWCAILCTMCACVFILLGVTRLFRPAVALLASMARVYACVTWDVYLVVYVRG